MVIQFGVGIEGVDEQACTSRKILLCFIPSEHTGNADSTAEMAVFHLLAAFRRVNQMADSIQTATLGDPWGRSITGSKVLVVGLGNVGGKVARLLKAFGCKLHTVWRAAAFPIRTIPLRSRNRRGTTHPWTRRSRITRASTPSSSRVIKPLRTSAWWIVDSSSAVGKSMSRGERRERRLIRPRRGALGLGDG